MANGWKKSPNAKPTVTITLDDELLKRIEDYQFDNRLRNRSQAIQELILKGMLDIDEESDKSEEE